MDPLAAKFLAPARLYRHGRRGHRRRDHFRPVPRRGVRNPSAAAGQTTDPVSRLRARGSVRHLLAADRASPPVRSLRRRRMTSAARREWPMALKKPPPIASAGRRPQRRVPPFERETFPSQIFWLAICFVALYLITARLVQPRVGGIIENRKSRIAAISPSGTASQREADAAMAAYRRRLGKRAPAPRADRRPRPAQAASRGGAQIAGFSMTSQRSARPGRKGDRRHQTAVWRMCAGSRSSARDRGAA